MNPNVNDKPIVANVKKEIADDFKELIEHAVNDRHYIATFLHPLLKNSSSFSPRDVERTHIAVRESILFALLVDSIRIYL